MARPRFPTRFIPSATTAGAGSNPAPVGAITHPIHQVSNLIRLYKPNGERFLSGFYNFEGGVPDSAFTVMYQPGGGYKCYILPTVTHVDSAPVDATIHSSGAMWHTVPYRAKPSKDSGDKTGFYAISTNAVDHPFVWVDGSIADSTVATPDNVDSYPFLLLPM